jgi:hypothetical protein
VGAEASNPQFLPKHTKEGTFITSVSLFCVYLCFFTVPAAPDHLQRDKGTGKRLREEFSRELLKAPG